MFKPRTIPFPRTTGVIGVGLLAIGVVLPFTPLGAFLRNFLPGQGAATINFSQESWQRPTNTQSLTAAQQRELETLAQKGSVVEQSRARFLLADASLQQGQGEKVLEWLNGLEYNYPLLAAQIAVKRAQAYEVLSKPADAQKAWQEILQKYPDNPARAEALIALGRQNPEYWEQAIAHFPAHPRTAEMIQQRLTQNPNQPQLLLVLARHALYLPSYLSILDQLTSRYSRQLQPQDWEAIAFGYWEHQIYRKAGQAYAKAPPTPLNLYRAGRGLQLGGYNKAARKAYQRLIQAFPKADETGLALLRLAQLVDSPQQALPYLEQATQNFPKQAPAALLAKIKALKKLQRLGEATQVQQVLLQQYGASEAAAELRWALASEQAKAGNFAIATQWATQITRQNAESPFAPEAWYWIGKWAEQAGRRPAAQLAFRQVLVQYPESYYAWRSASQLGWQVGDFTTVRHLKLCQNTCAETAQPRRPDLTAGSELLRELYRLGLDRAAWDLWQVEFKNPQKPTVAEQFTDGILRQGVGDYLDGIFMVSFLAQREDPAERSQYKALKQKPDYWYALYPLLYWDEITRWSAAKQVNPWLVIGLMRQESRFEAQIRSSAGAVGLMQVMPDTADWIASKIKLKTFDLENPIDNIQLGTWYLNYTHEEYNNNSMLAVASYNAGPGNVANWIQHFGLRNPDQFVEKIPFDETRDYVKAVFENYWNYLRLYNPEVTQYLAQQGSDAKSH